ncbi:MAG: chemotaxis protein CheB, partial [Betaproteobacteria bacterium]|nr:chemotaxis protein CheB [Betaproteobacteria bacterium]
AQFDAMPRSAAAIGPAVMVCTPSQMPQRLLAAAAATQPSAEGPAGADLTAAQSFAQSFAHSLALVLRQVAAFTGHDFSQYKTSTLERRIGRRMAVYGCASLEDYWRLLSANPQEAELLVKEMLIGVTSFFRDPAMWASAQQLTLPGLFDLAAQRSDPKLRAWVVGCSTGEEAYTVAMLLLESRDSNPAWRSVALQIFATDLSADAIQIARRGFYPAAISQSLSVDRLSRNFVPEHEGYRVSKALRESVLFVPHNLISDAPFSQIDLLTCRNLLIYFTSGLQQRILTLFHYVLRTGGCLLLGRAETIGRQAPLFPPIDVKLRIFGRGLHPRAAAAAVFPVKAFLMTPSIPQDAAPPAVPLQKLADRLMLDEFVPPAVLVSEEGDILYISGRTGRFLEPAAGKANWNIHAMARNGLRAALSTALRQVSSQGQALELRGLNVEHGGAAGRVDLLVRPVNLGAYGRLVLILFRPATAVPDPLPVGAPQALDGHDSELARSQDQTRALGEEMQSSQEELQSAVEELQATNEELQSANEELTTSKEEMQAMYEELQTVNAELLSKLEDLAVAQGDLNNLLDSTQIATLFLDRSMNVRRFTEQAKQVFSLRDVDIGRPLSDLRSSLEDTMLLDDIAEVLRTLVPCEKEVKADGGRLY